MNIKRKFLAPELKDSVLSDEAKNELQRQANAIARRSGYGRADSIVLGNENRISQHIRRGYRKYSTDEYVSNAYRSHFGWKNTYYSPAYTRVIVKV